MRAHLRSLVRRFAPPPQGPAATSAPSPSRSSPNNSPNNSPRPSGAESRASSAGDSANSANISADKSPNQCVAPTVKIADFGLAKLVGKEKVASTFCGTPQYFAPEVRSYTIVLF